MKMCLCGCGIEVRLLSHNYIHGHNSWNRGLTKETDKRVARIALRVSKTMKEQIASGQRSMYHVRQPLKGRHPWNFGLTKETDESVRLCNEKQSKTKTGHTKENSEGHRRSSEKQKGRIPWNKGLTKEVDERVRRIAEGVGNAHRGRTKETHPYLRRSPEARQNYRLDILRRIDESGSPILIGKHEKEILDQIENYIKRKIERSYRIIGYILDGYDPLENIVYEVDEHHHYHKVDQITHDIQKDEDLYNSLGCKIIRINEQEWLRSNGDAGIKLNM